MRGGLAHCEAPRRAVKRGQCHRATNRSNGPRPGIRRPSANHERYCAYPRHRPKRSGGQRRRHRARDSLVDAWRYTESTDPGGLGTARTRRSRQPASHRHVWTTCSLGRRVMGVPDALLLSTSRATKQSTGSGRRTMQPSSSNSSCLHRVNTCLHSRARTAAGFSSRAAVHSHGRTDGFTSARRMTTSSARVCDARARRSASVYAMFGGATFTSTYLASSTTPTIMLEFLPMESP
jgi:hypothetical protein